jgi:MSHA biogenesis protein MshM
MYRQHFGLKHAPLGKDCKVLWPHPSLANLKTRFEWLLHSPGLGLLTAEPGLGKTAALRQITDALNPHQYLVRYVAETDFGRLEFYRQLAQTLGLEPSYRRAQLWRDIKNYLADLASQKNILPVLIIDEAQNLPSEFFRDFPSFLNFVFDSKDYITVWLVGHPELTRVIDRPYNAALSSRIQARCTLAAIEDREEFKSFLLHGFQQAGCTMTILSDTAIEMLRMSSKGNPRQAHQIIVNALRLAADKKQNHLPDDIIEEAIEILRAC